MHFFAFQTTPSIVFSAGASGKIGELASERGCGKVAFVTDSIVLDLGIAAAALDSLKKGGVDVWVCSRVVPDPPAQMVLDAVEEARAERVDGVVAVGGGSTMDTAKLIAVLASSDQKLDDIYGIGKVKGGRLPLILAPTTAGTGSEATPISVITTGADEKKGVVSPQLLPDVAVLDPELTLGLPSEITSATGVDAMVHAIEAYTTKLKKNPISDCLAKQALSYLGSSIRTACSEPGNQKARANMLLGSLLAGMAFANAPTAGVHALALPLGARFHVPHGLSNALLLPHMMEYNLPAVEEQYTELAPIAFDDLDIRDGLSPGRAMIDRFVKLREELGMKTKLSEVGVALEDTEMLAEDAMKQERLLVNNPREIDYESALTVYRRAL